MSKQRIQYVDIARGLAMICIVLGHLGEAQINRVVFTFHVPIFFLISGYFFREGADLKSLLKRQTQTLIAPYWLTCLAIIGLSMVEMGSGSNFQIGFLHGILGVALIVQQRKGIGIHRAGGLFIQRAKCVLIPRTDSIKQGFIDIRADFFRFITGNGGKYQHSAFSSSIFHAISGLLFGLIITHSYPVEQVRE